MRKKTNKEKLANKVVDFISSENRVKESKPKIPKLLPLFILVIFLVTIIIAFGIEKLTDKEVGYLSNLITIAITIVIFYITIYNEKRKDYKLARKNALMLSETLDLISKRITQINNGNRDIIFYPQEWLEYYKQCSLYLNYSYFDTIIREINVANLINDAIKREDDSQLQEILENRRNDLINSTADFDILSTCENLRAFATEKDEEKPWKQQKQYINFEKYILTNYTEKIKIITEDRLKELNETCDVKIMQNYVANELRKNEGITANQYSHLISANKAINKAIFKVYLCLLEEDSFYLCWGMLTLKSKKDCKE